MGGFIGILLTAELCRWWSAAGLGSPWLVAPMGASAVLVFAVPSSPLAQPWAVVGGNTVSALVGVLCLEIIPDQAVAASVAVGLAIALMFALRCLHPPGGAAALLAVLSGAKPGFVAFPVLTNALVLVAAGIAYNRITGRAYPHVPAPSHPSRFSKADLDMALAHYNQVLDVDRGDLEELLEIAESASYERRFGSLRCADVMTPNPVAVQFGTSLEEAWSLMQEKSIKALPVTDRAQHIVGIVSQADFLRHADRQAAEGLSERLKTLVRRSGLLHSEKPEVVGQIMTREVRVASLERPVADLVPLFSQAGHHHIPIIDADNRLVGILTQSDLVRALFAATTATPKD